MNTNITSISDAELDAAIKDATISREKFDEILKILKEEKSSRELGIRVGERVIIDGKEYECAGVGYWPVFKSIKSDGKPSLTVRHAYGWGAYRKQLKNSPF